MEAIRNHIIKPLQKLFSRKPDPEKYSLLEAFQEEENQRWSTLLDQEGQPSWEEIREQDEKLDFSLRKAQN